MPYAINERGGWRAVDRREDLTADESYSEEQPPLTFDPEWVALRIRAAAELKRTDSIVMRHYEDGELIPTKLRDYRRALRAIHEAEHGDPALTQFPVDDTLTAP